MIPKDFVLPKAVKIQEGATDRFARFLIEPFERGYGTTVGNSLRRVLLASLEGSAVTAIRIENVPHEFTGIPGVYEDVTDIVLNFKRCQIRLNREEPLIFPFKFKGEGKVTAKDVFQEHDIDVFNPDQLIFTSVDPSTHVEMEIKVARGRGYVTAEQLQLEHAQLGTIYLDANFSPVTRVNFLVEDARVGQRTDYDRLILEVWTNGSITPEQAVQEAASLLIDHLRILLTPQIEEKVEPGKKVKTTETAELERLLSKSIDELEMSVRAANCLRAANINTIRDLVVRTEQEMLQFHNFGKKSLDEIKSILSSLGLSLGMTLGESVSNETATVEK
ncbi:MAG: DNA-directed RNA polymerase subunit alpha [Candidatus Hadarchaeum sp.]